MSCGIEEIKGLENNKGLEKLDLYQNKIKAIENIQHLTYLEYVSEIRYRAIFSIFRFLDLSFNEIRIIENLDTLVNMKSLLLANNKIERIQGLDNLTLITQLELGSNRIRVRLKDSS